jgi:hypothetical protein
MSSVVYNNNNNNNNNNNTITFCYLTSVNYNGLRIIILVTIYITSTYVESDSPS